MSIMVFLKMLPLKTDHVITPNLCQMTSLVKPLKFCDRPKNHAQVVHHIDKYVVTKICQAPLTLDFLLIYGTKVGKTGAAPRFIAFCGWSSRVCASGVAKKLDLSVRLALAVGCCVTGLNRPANTS